MGAVAIKHVYMAIFLKTRILIFDFLKEGRKLTKRTKNLNWLKFSTDIYGISQLYMYSEWLLFKECLYSKLMFTCIIMVKALAITDFVIGFAI